MDRVLALDERTGNALTAFLSAVHVSGVPGDAPMTAALVAVWCDRHLLLVFDRFRQQWELPGGGIDPGETPPQAAVRELHEESGLHLPTLTLAGYARFWLTTPPRSEYAAVYTAHTSSRRQGWGSTRTAVRSSPIWRAGPARRAGPRWSATRA